MQMREQEMIEKVESCVCGIHASSMALVDDNKQLAQQLIITQLMICSNGGVTNL